MVLIRLVAPNGVVLEKIKFACLIVVEKNIHPCITLHQTHYFVINLGISACYPGSRFQMGDSALVSCLSWQEMPENVQFPGEHDVSHAPMFQTW